jgi:hypothetical protein
VAQDAHAVHCRVPDYEDLAFFAVFDGHGGSLVSNARCAHPSRLICINVCDLHGILCDAARSGC